MSDTIATRIVRVKQSKITKSQRKLIDFLENADYKQIMYFTITEFAKATGIGEATILRFCRLLGFDGYQVFKLQIARELSSQEDLTLPKGKEDFRSYIAKAYENAVSICISSVSMELLEKVADLMLASDRISCFGVGNSYVAALELHNRLMAMGIHTLCESDAHTQNVMSSTSSDSDLVIVFSVSGSTKDVVEATRLAKHYGAKIVLITAHDVSPLTKLADLVISTGEPDIYREVSAMTNKVVQLYVIDALCESVRRKDEARFDGFIFRSRGATVGKLI